MLNYPGDLKLPSARGGNYDRVAPFYDKLSRLIYGDAILKAHQFLVNAIPSNTTILIAGGGTGQVLEEITRKHPVGLEITYVEASKKMMDIAKRKNTGANKVVFVNRPLEEVALPQQFNVVITPFLFDNFSDNTTKVGFDKLHQMLKPGGLWLFADFQVYRNNWWQKGLLKIMYVFFRIVCGIEASWLPDTDTLFSKNGYKVYSRQEFFRKFIYSVVYVKT